MDYPSIKGFLRLKRNKPETNLDKAAFLLKWSN